jgi:DNA-binding transcriptional regulator YiaG
LWRQDWIFELRVGAKGVPANGGVEARSAVMRKKQRATAEDSPMGERFRELRNRLRPDLASARDFGDALRPPVTSQTVLNWEHGRHIPRSQQRAVCKLLGCEPADLWSKPGSETLRWATETLQEATETMVQQHREMFQMMEQMRQKMQEAAEQSWKEIQEVRELDAKIYKVIVAKLMSKNSVADVVPHGVETVQEWIRAAENSGDKEIADFMRYVAKVVMPNWPCNDNGDTGGNGAQGAT